MSEVQLSPRAAQLWAWINTTQTEPFLIRQVTAAEALGCSRWTIGRAIKKLIAAGLLQDTGKRGDRGCKVYRHCERSDLSTEALAKVEAIQKSWIATSPAAPRNDENKPFHSGDAPGKEQLRLYRYTFESVFRDWPQWQKHYCRAFGTSIGQGDVS